MKKKKILYYTPILNFPFISGGFMRIDIILKFSPKACVSNSLRGLNY